MFHSFIAADAELPTGRGADDAALPSSASQEDDATAAEFTRLNVEHNTPGVTGPTVTDDDSGEQALEAGASRCRACLSQMPRLGIYGSLEETLHLHLPLVDSALGLLLPLIGTSSKATAPVVMQPAA